MKRSPWNKRRRPQERAAERSRLDEVFDHAQSAAADLRMDALVDVMVGLGVPLVPEAEFVALRGSQPQESTLLRVAKAIARRDRERNPTWGGEDAWDQLRQHQRADYLAMAEAALDAMADQPIDAL